MLSKHLLVPVAALACALAAATPASARPHRDDGVAAARQATARFHDAAVAGRAGYGLLRDAAGIACIDNPGVGGMGVHLVKDGLVHDATVDERTPEALVYQPRPDGRLRLVALEYIAFQSVWDAQHDGPPSLFGREFMLVPAGNRFGLPAFYELHVWAWKHNPRGLSDDWNPRVTCTSSSTSTSEGPLS